MFEISISDEIIDGIVTSLISGIGDNKSFHFGKNQVNIPSLVFFTYFTVWQTDSAGARAFKVGGGEGQIKK